MDQVKNLIKGTVNGTHNAITTTINVVDADVFPDPTSGKYNLTWYDATNYPDPADDPNVEIVRVTARDTGLDTLTVTRAQEGTSGTTKNTGSATYKLILAPTKKTMDEISDFLNPASASVAASIDLFEETDNGTNKITITAPASIASNKTITLPDAGGTIVTTQSAWDGWFNAVSAWSYSSWDSSVRTAVITTASDESGSISVGDRITFTQPTDGQKYAIVTAITSNSITAFMYDTQDFDNEAVNSPQYSHQDNPFGFDKDPEKWLINVTVTSGSQASPASATKYNIGSNSIDVPIGSFFLGFKSSVGVELGSTGTCRVHIGFATSTSGALIDPWQGSSLVNNILRTRETKSVEYPIKLSSKTTYYLNAFHNGSSAIFLTIGQEDTGSIWARCAYL